VLVGSLTVAGAASAGSVTPPAVSAVEGRPFDGSVATYAGTATSDERFVAQAYLDLLGRRPAPAELSFFATLLGSGETRAQVAGAIVGGDEYRGRVVGRAYQTFLRRPATPGELSAGVAALKAGATDEQFDALVLGSQEYLAGPGRGSVHGFLDALCQDVLGRAIDAPAEAVFTQQLANGQTRADVALEVVTSQEARQDLVGALYQRLLHRAPSASELQAAVAVLTGGGTNEDLTEALVGSAEYLQDVPASSATATIDWGDGSPASHVAVAGGTVSGSHAYAEEGSYPISVTVDDLDGTSSAAGAATVADAPLSAVASSLTVSPRTTFTRLVASVADGDPRGVASDFTATITWGDGKTSAGTVDRLAGGGFGVLGTHVYASAGTYTVVVHVADAGGAVATVTGKIRAT
jgi:hypothetical protein